MSSTQNKGPTPAPAATAGPTQLISPQDYRLYTIPRGQEEAYKKAGYFAPEADIDNNAIRDQFRGWEGMGRSFLISTLGGVPFAKTAIAGVSTQEQAKAWQESFDAAQREHPYLDFAGRVAGTIGGGAAIASGLGALGGAAFGGGALAAEGAVAEGAAAAGAGEVGAAGAALGDAGVAAASQGAALPAAEAVGTAASSGVGAAALEGAVSNATLGHIARIDDSALAHAADPEGKEKIQWMLNEHDFIDAAFGAALPGALGAFGKGLSYVGKKLDTSGLSLMRKSFVKAEEAEAIAQQGQTASLNQKLEIVMREGRSNPKKYAEAMVKNAGRDMEDVIQATNKTSLTQDETATLMQSIRRVLGKDNRVYPRLAAAMRKKAGTKGWINGTEWNVEDLKKINELIYKEIDFDHLHLRPQQNAQYINAANNVIKGMGAIFQRADPTAEQAMAQRWMTATKEYSDWSRTKAALKSGSGPATVSQILQSMFQTGGTAGAAAMVGAFSASPLTAATTGAGYAALSKINGYHYGAAARFFSRSFNNVGDRLTAAVEAGLFAAPSVLHTLASRKEYNDMAGKLSAIRYDPQTAFQNIRDGMAEAGYPEDMADEAALTQHAQIMFLANKLPARMTGPDVVTRGHGDPVQQRRLMGQVRTMRDPTYGILYPSKTNMEVLQQFYPNVLFNTQQAVLSQLQRNPNLPSASKLWASRILGRPINNLSSPTFFATLAAARQAAADAEQQAQQAGSPQRRRTGGGDSASSATRLDELQGGNE